VPAPRRAGFISGEKQMAEVTHMDIVRRAYELWQQAGEPEGRDHEFYLQAEKELNEGLANEPVILPG
jgi:Protein of unknown function (DUF2934)